LSIGCPSARIWRVSDHEQRRALMKLLNRFQSHASQQFHTRHADFLQRLTRSRPTWEERLTSSDGSSALTVRPLYGARHWLSAPGSRTQCKTSSALTVPTDDGPEGPFSLGPSSRSSAERHKAGCEVVTWLIRIVGFIPLR